MRDFVRPGAFDLAISMFTSFGYFDDKSDDLLVLRQLRESLRPGGFLLMELAGKEWLAEGFHPTTSEELPDGSLLVQRHEIFDDWSRIRNEWILIKGESVRRFKFHHTLYSGQELKDRLRQAGFVGVRLFGDLDGSELRAPRRADGRHSLRTPRLKRGHPACVGGGQTSRPMVRMRRRALLSRTTPGRSRKSKCIRSPSNRSSKCTFSARESSWPAISVRARSCVVTSPIAPRSTSPRSSASAPIRRSWELVPCSTRPAGRAAGSPRRRDRPGNAAA